MSRPRRPWFQHSLLGNGRDFWSLDGTPGFIESDLLRHFLFSPNARDAYMSMYNLVLAAAVIVLVGLLFVMRKKSEA